jgi:hypothetical protein
MLKFRVKIISSLVQLITLVIFPVVIKAQSPAEMKKIFEKAESYYVYEEYDLANQLYLLLDSTENANIDYKIGNCYLNIPGEKEKSIPYLEKAVKNASYESKTESFKEKRAPLDCYFSLYRAYLINDQLEKALNTLQTFNKLARETTAKGGMENLDYIEQQLQACRNAMEYQANPVTYSRRSLGTDFSQGSINDNPAVSFDGNSIVYTERRGLSNAIFHSRKERGLWQPPVEITSQINAGEDCSSSSLNSDGTKLFLYKTDSYDGAIYSSDLIDSAWTPIKKLHKNINTKFYESHASISSDGKKLYFTSNREGGYGNLDIYVSEMDASGDWGPAINLGDTINTPFHEDTPFITENDSILYFSSEGHSSMGGFDIFKSQRLATGWQTPENLGFPINTTDDDKFLQPSNDGKNGYYSMTTNYKEKGIFFLGFGGIDVNKIYEITGKLSLSDTIIPFDKNYYIQLVNRETSDTLDVGYPDNSGIYSFLAAPGRLQLIYKGPDYITQVIDTTIQADNPNLVVNLDVSLVRSIVYDKIDLTLIPSVAEADSGTLIRNLNVSDVGDVSIRDSDILYYTVQVMALHTPVDVTSFKYIDDLKVMYSDSDNFYRYTTGNFPNREEAEELRLELIRKSYPEEIFIKKVSK